MKGERPRSRHGSCWSWRLGVMVLVATAVVALVREIFFTGPSTDSNVHVLNSASDLQPSSSPIPYTGADPVYDAFKACPPGFTFTHDKEGKAKTCSLAFDARYVTQYNVSWGPVCPYLWGGDIGVWVNKDYITCPTDTFREVVRATRTYCVALLDWRDPDQRPWLQRLEPVCPTEIGSDRKITLGFRIRRAESAERVWGCPSSTDRKFFCESLRPSLPPPGSSSSSSTTTTTTKSALNPTVKPKMDSLADVLPRVAVDGRVVIAVASHQYAPLAVAWHAYTEFMGYHGAVVVALDPVAYTYLHNRNVPVALMEAIVPLDPCCLRRFRMIPFRMTNDVKPRALITALRLGYKTMMMDMDVRLYQPPAWDDWDKVSLMQTLGFSFRWTYVQPSPATIVMWEAVLYAVYTGSWDQGEYQYQAGQAEAAGHITVGILDQRKYLARMQNQEFLALHRFGAAIKPAWVHPDFKDIRKLVAWPASSPCIQFGSDDAYRLDWELWKACAILLIHAAKRMDRTAVLEPTSQYAFSEMANWFPIVGDMTVEAFGMLPESMDAYAGKTVAVEGAFNRRSPAAFAGSPLVYLVSSDPKADLSVALSHATAEERRRYEWYVLPAAPGRLQFKCMRVGGPPSASNPNPDQTCRGPTGDRDLLHPAHWPLEWPSPNKEL